MSEAIATDKPVENPTLGINDIQNAVRCIDFACEQGAYKGWDTIEKVLFIRNRLQAFVASAGPKEESAPATAPEAVPAAEDAA